MIPDHRAGAQGRKLPVPSRETAQNIWFLFVATVVAFAAVGTAVGPGIRQQRRDAPEFLVWVVLAMAPLAFLMARIVPSRIKATSYGTPDGLAHVRTITAVGLNFGAASWAIIAWMLNGKPLVLVAFAISLVGLLLAFPSRTRWQTLSAGSGETQRTKLVR